MKTKSYGISNAIILTTDKSDIQLPRNQSSFRFQNNIVYTLEDFIQKLQLHQKQEQELTKEDYETIYGWGGQDWANSQI